MKNECDNCGKLKEVKTYTWNFEKTTGIIDCCDDCCDSLKFSGYKMDRMK